MTDTPRKRGRPPSEHGETPRRSFRMTNDQWEELQRRAAEEGVTATEYIIRKTVGASR